MRVVSTPGREGRQASAHEVSVAAIVLAAGMSTRMGGQKVILPLSGRPVVQWVVDAALQSRVTQTIVVVGHEAELVVEALQARALTVVLNPDHERGMSTSLRSGVQATDEGCDAAIFLLGDQPFVTPVLLDRLIDRFAETRSTVVRPLVGGRPANPVLMSARLFPEILAQSGDVGGREIIDRHHGEVCLVPIDDLRVIVDIDTPADYAAAGGST
jgi:molybdenum cofactor cytidylyltransferase